MSTDWIELFDDVRLNPSALPEVDPEELLRRVFMRACESPATRLARVTDLIPTGCTVGEVAALVLMLGERPAPEKCPDCGDTNVLAENDRLRAAGGVDISAVDLRTAARVVRSSSWPLDMRPSMDALAARLDQAAAQIDGSGGSDD